MLALVREGRARTRAELAEATGLARSTVAMRVEALLRHGYLEAEEVARSSGGRPPTVLALNRGFGSVLAADFGATRAHLALCDLEAGVLAEQSHEIAVGEHPPEEALSWLAERNAELREDAGGAAGALVGVGVGIPAPVDIAAGRPVAPPLMPGWNEHPVAERLGERLGAPVVLDNDVNLMALGEQRLNWPGTDVLIFVKVATGIGCGIVIEGQVFRGAAGAAGDLGHVRAAGSEVPCRCGQRGCLEAIAAGPALARALGKEGLELAGAREVAAAIAAGDPRALAAAREAGREIGEAVATIVNFVNPSAVVFGGEIPDGSEDLLAGVRETVYRRSPPLATRGLEIAHSSGGHRAGIIGAAVMAIDQVLEPAAVDLELDRALRPA